MLVNAQHFLSIYVLKSHIWRHLFSFFFLTCVADPVQQLPVCVVLPVSRALAQRPQMPAVQERRQAAPDLGQRHRARAEERTEMSAVQGETPCRGE